MKKLTRTRLSKLHAEKLRERSAVLYGRELERWSRRLPGYGSAVQG